MRDGPHVAKFAECSKSLLIDFFLKKIVTESDAFTYELGIKE